MEIEEGPITALKAADLKRIIELFPHFQLFRCMRVNKFWCQVARSINLTTLDLRTFYGHFADEHLASIVAKHPDLQVVRIQAAPRLTDKSMKVLAKLQSLTGLDLSNCRNLSDTAISKLSTKVTQRLVWLKLTHCGFSEKALKVGSFDSTSGTASTAGQWGSLQSLDISHCDGLSSTRFALILSQTMPNLTKLDVSNSPVLDNDFLAYVPKIPNLKWLNLHNCQVMDNNGFYSLADQSNTKLPPLTYLDVSTTRINNAALLRICTYYTSLTSLSLSFCHRLDDEGFASLKQLSGLTFLNLSYTGIGTASLPILEALPLTTLNISGCEYLKKHTKQLVKNHPKIRIVARLYTLPPPPDAT